MNKIFILQLMSFAFIWPSFCIASEPKSGKPPINWWHELKETVRIERGPAADSDQALCDSKTTQQSGQDRKANSHGQRGRGAYLGGKLHARQETYCQKCLQQACICNVPNNEKNRLLKEIYKRRGGAFSS